MDRVVHFEIHAPDPAKALEFYSQVFGWQASSWEGGDTEYWLLTTGKEGTPGINGGLLRSRDGQARVVNTVQVRSVDETIEKVLANGGQVVVSKMPIPGVGYLAYATDPGGAIFGMMHSDPSASG